MRVWWMKTSWKCRSWNEKEIGKKEKTWKKNIREKRKLKHKTEDKDTAKWSRRLRWYIESTLVKDVIFFMRNAGMSILLHAMICSTILEAIMQGQAQDKRNEFTGMYKCANVITSRMNVNEAIDVDFYTHQEFREWKETEIEMWGIQDQETNEWRRSNECDRTEMKTKKSNVESELVKVMEISWGAIWMTKKKWKIKKNPVDPVTWKKTKLEPFLSRNIRGNGKNIGIYYDPR